MGGKDYSAPASSKQCMFDLLILLTFIWGGNLIQRMLTLSVFQMLSYQTKLHFSYLPSLICQVYGKLEPSYNRNVILPNSPRQAGLLIMGMQSCVNLILDLITGLLKDCGICCMISLYEVFIEKLYVLQKLFFFLLNEIVEHIMGGLNT